MNAGALKIVGISCLVVCVICLFVAYERYQANASNVNAANQLFGSTPLGELAGNLRPAMPAITKYALFFAALAGLGGAGCLIYANTLPQPKRPDNVT